MRRFHIRRDTPGAGAEILAEGVTFQDGGPVAARLVAGGSPIVWASVATMQSIWCYGDLGRLEWIDQGDADAASSRRLVVSVTDVNTRLVLGLSKPARPFWDVTYSYRRQPYGVLWPDSWGPPPVRGDQIELELDDMFQVAKARVLIPPPTDMGELAADAEENEGANVAKD